MTISLGWIIWSSGLIVATSIYVAYIINEYFCN